MISAIEASVSRPTKSDSVSGPIGLPDAGDDRLVDVLDRADTLLVGADPVEHVGDEQPVDDEAAVVAWRRRVVLRSRSPSSKPSSTASSEVGSARTTSSRRITWAGLKKCRPRNLSGLEVAAAWSATESDEVLVAKTASGLTIESISRHISSLRVEVLGDRLDHQVAVGELAVVERGADPVLDRVCVGLLELALARPRARAASRSSRSPRRARPGRSRERRRPSRPRRRSARSRGPSGHSRRLLPWRSPSVRKPSDRLPSGRGAYRSSPRSAAGERGPKPDLERVAEARAALGRTVAREAERLVEGEVARARGQGPDDRLGVTVARQPVERGLDQTASDPAAPAQRMHVERDDLPLSRRGAAVAARPVEA